MSDIRGANPNGPPWDEATRDYVDQDGTPVLTERRAGVVQNAIGRRRAELMGRIQRVLKLAGTPASDIGGLLKEVALFLAHGGDASDTDVPLVDATPGVRSYADLSTLNEERVRAKLVELGWTPPSAKPKNDPLQSWIGNGLRETGESAYTLRREAPSFDSGPRTVAVPDWASSAGRIQTGLSHLDEALPGGQRRRTQLAVLEMERGLEELKVWLRDAGVVL